jgi:hypothetical protein
MDEEDSIFVDRRTSELADLHATGRISYITQTRSAPCECYLCGKRTAYIQRIVFLQGQCVELHAGCYDGFLLTAASVRESIFAENKKRVLAMIAAGVLVRDVRGHIARYLLSSDPEECYRMMSLVKFPPAPALESGNLASFFIRSAADGIIQAYVNNLNPTK